MIFSPILYGTDLYAYPSDLSYPLRSAVSSQTDVVSFEPPNVVAINISPKLDSENIKYINFSQDYIGTIRYSFEIQSIEKFPSENITPESFWGLEIWKKRYKYLWLGNYPLRPSRMQSQERVIPVILVGISVENQKGLKVLKLTLEEVYGY